MCIFDSSGAVDVTVTEADSIESPMTTVQHQEKAEVKETRVKEEQKQILLRKQSKEEKVKDIRATVQEKETVKQCSSNNEDKDKVEKVIMEMKEDTKERAELDDEQMDQEAETTAEDTDTTEVTHSQETVYVIMISPGDITEGDTDVQDEHSEATMKEDDDSQEEIDVTTEYTEKPLARIIRMEPSSSPGELTEQCKEENVVKSEQGVTEEEDLGVSQEGHITAPAVSQEGHNLVQELDAMDHDDPKRDQDVTQDYDEKVVMLHTIHNIVQEPDILQQERSISKEEQQFVLREAWDVSHKELDVDNHLQKEPEPHVTQEAKALEECDDVQTTQDEGVVSDDVMEEQKILHKQQIAPQQHDSVQECCDVRETERGDLASQDEHGECSLKESMDTKAEHSGSVETCERTAGQEQLYQQSGAPEKNQQQEVVLSHEELQELNVVPVQQTVIPMAEEPGIMEQEEHSIANDVPEHEASHVQQEYVERQDVMPNDQVVEQQEIDNTKEQTQFVIPEEHDVTQQGQDVTQQGQDVTQQGHDMTQQEHIVTQQEHDVPWHEHNVTQQEQDVTQQGHDVTQQKHDVTQQGDDVTQQRHDVTQQGHDVTQQKHDVTQQGHDVTQQRHDVTQQGHNVTQQGHDMTQQEHSVTQQEHDVTQQKHDVTQQGHDVTQQRHDVTQQGHDVTQQGHDVTQQGHDVTQQGHDVIQQGHDVAQPRHEVTWDEQSVPVHEPGTCGHIEMTREHVDIVLKGQVSMQDNLEENKINVTLKEPDINNRYELDNTRGEEALPEDDDMDATMSSQSETTESLSGSPQMQFDDDEEMEVTEPHDPDWSMVSMEADKEDNYESSSESTECQEDSDTMFSSQITAVEDTETEQGTTQHSLISSSSTQEQEIALATSTSEKENVTASECQPDEHSSQATADSSEVNIGESCEAEGREMIDSGEELERQQKSSLLQLATDLLEQWSDLKEVYRIPKRSSPPVSSRTVSL